MTRPLVNLVVPVFNKAAFVKETIDSIKAQTLNNFTVAIVDDCSADNSAEVIQDAIKDDARFTYYRNPQNLHVALTRNFGVEQGDAPFVCCVDGDDQIAPEFLEVCVDALRKDRSLGAVYTGITIIKPDGSRELSQWPNRFNFDEQLKGRNQIPTCAVCRREMWERLGGQRDRYTDRKYGCGAEDAETWLRMGAYGWDAKKVTDAGFFWYRLGGAASSNKDNIAWNVNAWREWHPWCEGKAPHPFASLASSSPRPSHPVHQYDQPKVSVVIPVGPNHGDLVIDALDSLESQTFTHFEVIVVWDGPHDSQKVARIKRAYPYVKYLTTGAEAKGAGFARNRGMDIARAPLATFLDSDDILYPYFLEKCFLAYLDTKDCIYTGYVTKAYIKDLNDPTLARDIPPRVKWRDESTGETIIGWKVGDFDCARALLQPEQGQDPYIWCNINVLFPTQWHREIGGFDEKLSSWEDLDWTWRMARAGHCFTPITEELMLYRVYTGSRRQLACPESDSGRQLAQNLLQYIRTKYDTGEKPVGCSGCGRKAPVNSRPAPVMNSRLESRTAPVNDDDVVMVKLNSGNIGEMSIVGPATKQKYGMKVHGETFLMYVVDQRAQPDRYPIFQLDLPQAPREEVKAPEPIAVAEVKAPEPIKVAEERPMLVVEYNEEAKPSLFDQLLEASKEPYWEKKEELVEIEAEEVKPEPKTRRKQGKEIKF